MNFIRHICKDTFDKCLVMLHPKPENKDTHEYSNVGHEMQEDVFHDEEEDDAFAAWPTQKTETTKSETQTKTTGSREIATSKSQSTEMESPTRRENKPMLIGNLDEESLPKKKDVMISIDSWFRSNVI